MRFEDKVVLVTGAASGIGSATARRFAAEGASLMLGDVDEEGLAATLKELAEGGARAAAQPTDVADLSQVEALTNAAVERFGRLDVVFNNAGIGAYGRSPDLDPEAWRRTIEVDLHSVFYGCRAAIPHLRAGGGGAIVNTASISGLHGDYGLAAYNAAKGGVAQLHEDGRHRPRSGEHSRQRRVPGRDRNGSDGTAARKPEPGERVREARAPGTRRARPTRSPGSSPSSPPTTPPTSPGPPSSSTEGSRQPRDSPTSRG